MIQIKRIPKEFTGRGEVKGIEFLQILRFKLLCLYKRSDGYFEIISLRVVKGRKLNFSNSAVLTEPRERYPKGNEWRTHEKTCKGYPEALALFQKAAIKFKYDIHKELAESLEIFDTQELKTNF